MTIPTWSKVLAGVLLSGALMGIAGFKAYSEKLGPLVQEHGTTYYNGDGPVSTPAVCKSESEILAAIKQVHAKYDYRAGDDLKAFEERAAELKGLPPLNIEALYVITEDDRLRDGETVLFIGLKTDCVTTVFGLPTKFYRELLGKSASSQGRAHGQARRAQDPS